MTGDFDDLIPLFVAEGERRLETLQDLASQLDSDPAAMPQAKRELHTLKGSSRMLKLGAVAELCHQGEGLLQDGEGEIGERLTEVLDRLCREFERLKSPAPATDEESAADATEEKFDEPPPSPPSEAPPTAALPDKRRSSSPTTTTDAVPQASDEGALGIEHRISQEAADRLAGTAAAMRILALSGIAANSRLGELTQLAESGVTEGDPHQVLAMLSSGLRRLGKDFDLYQQRLLRHAEGQLERLLDLQLQPLRPFLQNLGRHARELARQLGKEIHVEILGGEARLDQRIVGELRGAFLHLVRNSVDHGIEAAEARRDAGKPARGTLTLEATSHGERIEISVRDDGGGIDPEQVLERARETGLIDSNARLSEAEIFQLLFVTGFSTRREISDVSGRGVGLDAVADVVRRLGGDVWLESTRGKGSAVVVEVPAARRGERVLVLRLGRERLALPKSAVRWISSEREDVIDGDDGMMLRREGRLERVLALADLLSGEAVKRPVFLGLHVAGMERILAVDAVEGEDEVLVRPFRAGEPVPEVYSGVALLPSGEPVAVLQPRALTRVALSTRRRQRRMPAAVERRICVLLVEDSLVTREMERRMLEEEGFDVSVASDAEEALSRLGERTFDCMVTDLEMPGMDGLDLTRHVRSSERLAQMPIVMVSTRDSSGDRLAGLEAGADAYLSKKRLESRELAGIIRRLGGGR